jgi:hypothetical protein
MWGVTVVWAFMLLVAGVDLFGARRRVISQSPTQCGFPKEVAWFPNL